MFVLAYSAMRMVGNCWDDDTGKSVCAASRPQCLVFCWAAGHVTWSWSYRT